jgi:glycosyltransferase involved in cell wall biosynthesis
MEPAGESEECPPDVSVVLPVYNEAGHIRAEVDRIREGLDQSDLTYEVIAVDDGSTDDSADELRQIEGIRLIQFTENRGSGTTRKVGTRAARGRVVVWTDADMTYPNHEIADLVNQLAGYDQVVGSRRSEEGTLKALRVPAKWLIRRLASYLTSTSIPDLNSGFRAFRREVGLQYMKALPPGFSCVTTITMTFLANGYSIRYVPIDYTGRAGRSKFHWFRDTVRYLTQVIRMVLSYRPLRVFVPAGLALLLLAAGKLVYDWVSRDFRLATNTLLIFFAAFQLLAIGLLADLVVRQTKPEHEVEPASL